MSQAAAQHAPDMSSYKMLRAMVGIGILCALLIVLTYDVTLERIADNKAAALDRAIFEVVPGMVDKKDVILDANGSLVAGPDIPEGGRVIYAGYDSAGSMVGVAVEASGQGFADILRVLYGYDLKKQAIVGFYVLESKETPGLGDKIEKDAGFLANFEALDVAVSEDGQQLKNPIVAVKHGEKNSPWEIDCITGATISSRAISGILNESTTSWIPRIKALQPELETLFMKNKNTDDGQ